MLHVERCICSNVACAASSLQVLQACVQHRVQPFVMSVMLASDSPQVWCEVGKGHHNACIAGRTVSKQLRQACTASDLCVAAAIVATMLPCSS